MELIFNTCGELQWSPEGPVSQIHSPHLHDVRSFTVCSDAKEKMSDLLRSVQMLKRKWVAESNGKLLQPCFLSLRWKTCLWAELQPWYLSYSSSTERWSLNKWASEDRNIEEVRHKIKVSNHSATRLVRFWQKPNLCHCLQSVAIETTHSCQTGTFKPAGQVITLLWHACLSPVTIQTATPPISTGNIGKWLSEIFFGWKHYSSERPALGQNTLMIINIYIYIPVYKIIYSLPRKKVCIVCLEKFSLP